MSALFEILSKIRLRVSCLPHGVSQRAPDSGAADRPGCTAFRLQAAATAACLMILSGCCSTAKEEADSLAACQKVRDTPTDKTFSSQNWQQWAPGRLDQVVMVTGTIDWINSRPTKTFTIGSHVFCDVQPSGMETIRAMKVGTRVRVKGIMTHSYPEYPPHPASLHLDYCLLKELK
ncbi:MAG: hypothetical protein EOP86_10895 [Verrucomicrobiaceae bacterium]|nr:MAG: hypothetical protein EOP86_10895 [Verrucomicrobiaceae bacterium]